ncbi:MAG: prepilin-type N-terminal cleavage/methylation domain-containing protein [Planctomycetes bacterium]|nr:prepilin-type N-terminal cleavage/methylation domain-containing protein [Planctomycetota bacterium]MBI3844101.1 prepilin-type N-terminal cleavage/methylation domain-containing protein [Planctomycetota bacterium]
MRRVRLRKRPRPRAGCAGLSETRSVRPRLGRDGFTLIELMMGSFVLSVSLLGMFGMMAASFGMSRSAREITVAKNAAMRKLEEIRDLARTNASQVVATYGANSNARHFDVDTLNAATNDADGKPGEVTVSPSSFGFELLDVVVSVQWQSGAGPKTFELRSRVFGR